MNTLSLRARLVAGVGLILSCVSAAALTVNLDGGGGELVAAGETWRYFKGTGAPSDPADAWRENGFDDSGWLEGPAGFGYGDGDDATVLDDMRMTGSQDGYATVYVRREFELDEVPTGSLELLIDYDDGFLAYLNGFEVQRSANMPPGEPTFATTTNGDHEAGTVERFVLGAAGDLLQAGTNVLAIEGHNGSLNSSDFSLSPSLELATGTVRDGSAWIVESASPALSGTVSSAEVVAVALDGVEVDFDVGAGQWTGNASLSVGLNTVLVEGRDAEGAVVESATIELIYLPAANRFAGALAGDTSWSGAVLLEDTVTVPGDVTLTIDPGTQVMARPGASLLVNGRLLAVGTEGAPIRFTHYGDGTTWERILLAGAEDSRLAHCVIEFSDCEGDHKDYYDDDCDDATPPPSRTYFQAVVAVACHVEIEDCLFHKLPDDRGGAEGDAIAIISDDPDVPGAATATIRRCEFIGIGQGVHTRFASVLVEECFFTGHNGDNDDIDLYGESVPPPLILNNLCINPGHDDMINPTRCSAILIGNVIAGSDDHGIVLRDKCEPVLINNLIYNCASGGIAIQNQCNALLINNTIVDCGRGLRFFDHTGRWGPPYCLFPGSGSATLINCLIRDCPTTFALEDSPWAEDMGSHLTVSYCNVEGGQAAASISANSTLTWGEGNFDADPAFVDAAGGDFRLRSAAGRWDFASESWVSDAVTSPCIDAGLDLRALYPELAPWLAADFDGLPRPLDGNGDAMTGVDVGAHEVITETADSSGDGIPDGWSFRHGLNPLDPQLASGNPDQDPRSTGEEWLADTDPTDRASWFQVREFSGPGPFTVTFASSAARLYTLYRSPDLVAWTPVPGQVNLPGTGGQMSMSDDSSASRVFYRVEVKLP